MLLVFGTAGQVGLCTQARPARRTCPGWAILGGRFGGGVGPLTGPSTSVTVRVHSSASAPGLTGANEVLPRSCVGVAGNDLVDFVASREAGIDIVTAHYQNRNCGVGSSWCVCGRAANVGERPARRAESDPGTSSSARPVDGAGLAKAEPVSGGRDRRACRDGNAARQHGVVWR